VFLEVVLRLECLVTTNHITHKGSFLLVGFGVPLELVVVVKRLLTGFANLGFALPVFSSVISQRVFGAKTLGTLTAAELLLPHYRSWGFYLHWGMCVVCVV